MRNLRHKTSRAVMLGLFFLWSATASAQSQLQTTLERLEARTVSEATGPHGPAARTVLLEVVLPQDVDEAKKMKGNALLLIRTIAPSDAEATTIAAYVDNGSTARDLLRIGASRTVLSTQSPTSATFGTFQEDALYYLPLKWISQQNRVVLMLKEGEAKISGGTLSDLPPSAPRLGKADAGFGIELNSRVWKRMADREIPGIKFSEESFVAEARSKQVRTIPPRYPEGARRQHLSGSVILSVLIDGSGHVKQVDVVSGQQPLADAAVQAVKQWRYKPYVINGKAFDVELQTSVNFNVY